MGFHDGKRVAQRFVGEDGHRIDHHAALEFLHAADLVRLGRRQHVLMNDTHATGLGHGNGQASLGDGIHSRGNQRDVEFDRTRKARRGVGLGRKNGGFRRLKQNVVEGQALADFHNQPR